MNHGLEILLSPSISCFISFLDVALSMTASRTDNLLAGPPVCTAEDGAVWPLTDPSLAVCWRIAILVWIGMPGMSFSAMAFRIAARDQPLV